VQRRWAVLALCELQRSIMQYLTEWFRRIWLILLVAGIVIVLDQWTKSMVRATIPYNEYIIPFAALGEYFVFHHVHNYGAAFGMFQGGGNFFVVVAIVVGIGILVYARQLQPEQRFVRVLLGLQLGGAFGNLIDRLQRGYVTDFVRMGIPGVYYWPNYNIADASIVCGVIALAIYLIWDDMRQARATAAASGVEPKVENLPAEQ